MKELELSQDLVAPNKSYHLRESRYFPSNFFFLPVGFIKLNFDKASKGNPGLAGYGGIVL